MDTLMQTIIDLAANNWQVSRKEVVPEANLADDLGVDSLDRVEFIMDLEERFDIEIPDEDAEQFKTIQDVYNYINKTKGGVS